MQKAPIDYPDYVKRIVPEGLEKRRPKSLRLSSEMDG